MPVRVEMYEQGLANLDLAIAQFGPSFANRLLGPSLAAAADVVRDRARERNYGFTDRSGALRKSIRTRRIPAVYFGRRYRTGRAGVFAGRRRQARPDDPFYALFVERGHGGPRPAPPYPYLDRALVETQTEQHYAFSQKAEELFPGLLEKFNRLGPRRRITGQNLRTRRITLRGRRR